MVSLARFGRAYFQDANYPLASPPAEQVSWSFGEIRGGTPPQRISKDLFLAFFHTKAVLPGSRLLSYFFGAYTFTAAPPFRLRSISRMPLVHRAFYDGPWSHYGGLVDYIVFPMSFVILPPGTNLSQILVSVSIMTPSY